MTSGELTLLLVLTCIWFVAACLCDFGHGSEMLQLYRELRREALLKVAIRTLKYEWPPYFNRWLAGLHEFAFARLVGCTWAESIKAARRYWP